MHDIEGLAGMKRTKGGANDTEPAYIVARKTCWRYLMCVGLMLVVGACALWRSDEALRRIAPKLANRRAAYRRREHSAHSRFTKLGQELEQHLEQDMHEREKALKLRARLRTLERTHRLNVTRALDAAALGTEDFTFESKAALAPYIEGAIDALFEELVTVLEQRIVAPMMVAGGQASDRHHQLHQEILEELRRDAAERATFLEKEHNAPADVDGDGYADHHYGASGGGGHVEDRHWVDEVYDEAAAARRDEEWRAEVIAHFKESFARHFNDTATDLEGGEPRALLEPDDQIYRDLVDIGDRLGFPADLDPSSNTTTPQLTWRDAEVKLAELKPLLDAKRCPPFVPSEPPVDDEYDYMQLHNVEHYVSELRWQGLLNQRKDYVREILADHDAGEIQSMDLVEKLESLEGDRVFPSFWLFHSAHHWDDYHYGDW